MTKKQHYMTRPERDQLEALLRAKLPVAQIARQLGFCRQTIYNEMARGRYLHTVDYRDVERYSADKGQAVHDYNQTAKGRPLKIGKDRAFADFLEKKMLGIQGDGKTDRRKRYSPGAALAAARKEGFTTSVCVSTLYSYIDKRVFLCLSNKDLWEKGRRKKRGYRPVRRVAHPLLPSISDRPESIGQRKEYGHQEMDLVVGKAGSKGVLLTLTERKTLREQIFLLQNKKAATVRAVFDKLETEEPDFSRHFRSLTTDNGPEFLRYEELRRSIRGGERFAVYYCHSYAAWEKGRNENQNRMIRRWFPKGTDFSKVSLDEVRECQDWMNGYPRRSLGWLSPEEAFRSISST